MSTRGMSDAERWSVWCEHDDGRKYMMGDASETRWSRETAERVAQHMRAHEVGVFTARPCPSPTAYEHENDVRHHEAYKRACARLWQAFATYQEWQDDSGDADTFASWAREEIPNLMPVDGG